MRRKPIRDKGPIYPYIEFILNQLFRAEERRLHNFILQMNECNNEAHGRSYQAFMYQGQTYRATALIGKIPIAQLHPTLQEPMDVHLKDRAKIEEDKQDIQQLLFILLEPTSTMVDKAQALRDATPECIADTLPENVRMLSRCCNPSFFLNHERDFKLYAEVLPKLEFYSAARLLY